MKILVTAFGPFDGRLENASSLALLELKKRLPEIHTRILPVDSVIAPKRLKQALRMIDPDALIMLGEAAGSLSIRLETTAWNEMDFTIPDLAGRQPRRKIITSGAPVFRPASMEWDKIFPALLTEHHAAILSNDPGRYLCNQIFHVAMDQVATRHPKLRAGFIHLPLAKYYPTLLAADALSTVVRHLWETVA